MDIKRIKFERTGGFAGIRLAADIELDEMPKDQAEQILELLDDMDFDELPENLTGKSNVADGFNYCITIESDKREHTVTAAESAISGKMESLLELLTKIARQQARNKK